MSGVIKNHIHEYHPKDQKRYLRHIHTDEMQKGIWETISEQLLITPTHCNLKSITVMYI